MKKFRNPFADLTPFERGLWCTSVAVIVLSAVLMGGADLFSVIASLIGVTALIFVAKGYVIGQILTVVFALFYGVISFHQRYFGEMITYLGMSSPMAIAAAIIICGLVIDWMVWLIRWQPYHLWARKLRKLIAEEIAMEAREPAGTEF